MWQNKDKHLWPIASMVATSEIFRVLVFLELTLRAAAPQLPFSLLQLRLDFSDGCPMNWRMVCHSMLGVHCRIFSAHQKYNPPGLACEPNFPTNWPEIFNAKFQNTKSQHSLQNTMSKTYTDTLRRPIGYAPTKSQSQFKNRSDIRFHLDQPLYIHTRKWISEWWSVLSVILWPWLTRVSFH